MEEILNILGQSIVRILQEEMSKPRPRFSKRGEMSKGSYNFVASGNLKNSVEYKIVDEEIVILMADYGVEYVFSDLAEAFGGEGGSWPGGGKYYPDTRQPGQKAKFSPLIKSLTDWAKSKLQLNEDEAKSMAFAVRTSLFKAGYKGLPLFTDEVNNLILEELNNIINDDQYAEILTDDILDRIRVFGLKTYNIAIG